MIIKMIHFFKIFTLTFFLFTFSDVIENQQYIQSFVDLTEVVKWSGYISYFSVLLPLCLFLLNRSKFTKESLYILGILLCVTAAFHLVSYLLVESGVSNLPLTNFYLLIQFLLISWMYKDLLKKRNTEFIKIPVMVFIGVFIINTVFGQGLFILQSFTNTMSSIMLVYFSISYFNRIKRLPYKLNNDFTPGKDVKFKTLHFINMAVFLYFVIDFLLFTVIPLFLNPLSEQSAYYIDVFNNTANSMKNIWFAIGLYWAGRID